MAGPALLAVLAHPDDEAYRCGGTLALLARQGVRVTVLTATRGEAGSCGDGALRGPEDLGAVREDELRCACTILGLDPPLLLGYPDGALHHVEAEEGVSRLMSVIRELRPQVLLTWPPHGLSGHPDHRVVSRWVWEAFARTADWGAAAPVAVYHLAVPRSLVQALGLSHLHATPDSEITLVVDVNSAWDAKMAAIRCHRSQMAESPILQAPHPQQRLFLGTEHLVRAALRGSGDFVPEVLGPWILQPPSRQGN
jgi:N-acetyl-1-D-myo-inositol-2-amino-2-deoxy-alpha-D-glucopyranoside deacetylase